jgi:hypothetical protein
MKFGCPDEIITDRGSNFLAGTLAECLSLQEIKHLKTSAYHPRTNGKTERYNGTLGSILTKLVAGSTSKWDMFLEQAVFNTRIRPHSITNISPYRLVYGMDPKIPGDDTRPWLCDMDDEIDSAEFQRRELEEIFPAREAAREAQENAARVMSRTFNPRVTRPTTFPHNSYVLVGNEIPRKFDGKWLGPYRLRSEEPLMGSYELEDCYGNALSVRIHANRLKAANVGATPPTTPWAKLRYVTTREDDNTEQESVEALHVPAEGL